jgi:hypothetical protein
MEKNKKQEFENNQICRALIKPTDDNSEFDFEAVAVPTDNKQLRYSYENDEYFYQILRTGKENIITDRLDSGLPVFDNHPWENSASNTLGITTGYDFTDTGLVTRVKLGARADEALKEDIKNKIIKTVSIEGSVRRYIIERIPGQVPIYYADLWEPESLSFAPVPNDISAQIEVKRALKNQIEESGKKQPESDSLLNSLLKKY